MNRTSRHSLFRCCSFKLALLESCVCDKQLHRWNILMWCVKTTRFLLKMYIYIYKKKQILKICSFLSYSPMLTVLQWGRIWISVQPWFVYRGVFMVMVMRCDVKPVYEMLCQVSYQLWGASWKECCIQCKASHICTGSYWYVFVCVPAWKLTCIPSWRNNLYWIFLCVFNFW